MSLDELLVEWSYRTKKGYPDLGNPSDILILKEILERLELPIDVLDELEDDEPKIDDSEELKSIEDVEDEIEDQTGKDICDVNNLILSIKKLASQGRINPKNINYYQKMLQNTCTYDPVLDLLRTKGYGQKVDKKGRTSEHPIVKKYADEIKNLTLNATEAERDIYIEYISTPDKQINFEPKAVGNLYEDAMKTGIPKSIISKIMEYVTTDSGNKGVGMGEFGMSLIFKNVGDAVGPGDLSLNGETFEIKGHNATLGKRPDEINAIDVSLFAKYMFDNYQPTDEKAFLFRKEKRKTKAGKDKNVNILYYKGNEVKKSTFSTIISEVYSKTNDKQGFLNEFKEALRELDTAKKEKQSEAINEFFDDIDFSSPQGVQNGFALLNFYRYILKEEFEHFLAHDFGKQGAPGVGDYVYAKGSAREMTQALMNVATFQPISPDNLKPRIGFGKSFRENFLSELFY